MKYISLGFFCSIAMELEKLGLREESSPFDWLISDFEGVMLAIENHFVDFLNEQYLYQNKRNRSIYRNVKYNFEFYHDFDKYIPLKEQLPQVQEKYDRRIARFYNSISEPTLFIRYIEPGSLIDGKPKELVYIENSYEHILSVIKSFNAQNDILFIANDGIHSDKLEVFHVQADAGDAVARNPIHKNPELFQRFNSIDFPDKQKNIDRHLRKEARKNNPYYWLKKKAIAGLKLVFLKKYMHKHQY